MQVKPVIRNELQMDSQLCRSVHEARRGDFAWLLASLSADALDFAQFHLPKSVLESHQVDEQQLRLRLGAAPAKPTALPDYQIDRAQHDRALLAQSSMTTLRLKECLTPEPLAVRDDKTYVPLPIIDNCDPSVQAKHHRQYEPLNEPQMDSAAFYDQLVDINKSSSLAHA